MAIGVIRNKFPTLPLVGRTSTGQCVGVDEPTPECPTCDNNYLRVPIQLGTFVAAKNWKEPLWDETVHEDTWRVYEKPCKDINDDLPPEREGGGNYINLLESPEVGIIPFTPPVDERIVCMEAEQDCVDTSLGDIYYGFYNTNGNWTPLRQRSSWDRSPYKVAVSLVNRAQYNIPEHFDGYALFQACPLYEITVTPEYYGCETPQMAFKNSSGSMIMLDDAAGTRGDDAASDATCPAETPAKAGDRWKVLAKNVNLDRYLPTAFEFKCGDAPTKYDEFKTWLGQNLNKVLFVFDGSHRVKTISMPMALDTCGKVACSYYRLTKPADGGWLSCDEDGGFRGNGTDARGVELCQPGDKPEKDCYPIHSLDLPAWYYGPSLLNVSRPIRLCCDDNKYRGDFAAVRGAHVSGQVLIDIAAGNIFGADKIPVTIPKQTITLLEEGVHLIRLIYDTTLSGDDLKTSVRFESRLADTTVVADKCALCEGGGEWADDPWWTADLGDNESGVPIAEVDVALLSGRRTAEGGGAASSPEKYAVVRQLQHGPRYPATEATGGGGYEGPFSVSRNAPDDENPPPEGTSIYTVYRGMIIKGCSLIDIPDQEISVLNEGSFCIMFYFDGTYYRLVSENSPMPPTQEEYAVPIATVENGDIWQVQYGTIQLPQRYLG